jgi:hypothetical protein
MMTSLEPFLRRAVDNSSLSDRAVVIPRKIHEVYSLLVIAKACQNRI